MTPELRFQGPHTGFQGSPRLRLMLCSGFSLLGARLGLLGARLSGSQDLLPFRAIWRPYTRDRVVKLGPIVYNTQHHAYCCQIQPPLGILA